MGRSHNKSKASDDDLARIQRRMEAFDDGSGDEDSEDEDEGPLQFGKPKPGAKRGVAFAKAVAKSSKGFDNPVESEEEEEEGEEQWQKDIRLAMEKQQYGGGDSDEEEEEEEEESKDGTDTP
jgi:hypothetical protein